MAKSNKNLAQQISDQLYNQIIQGSYRQGSKLPTEMELAEKYNVSRTTIREAIRTLSAQGLLQVKRGSGTYVVGDTDKFNRTPFKDFEHMKIRMRDLMEVRLIIEPECAALTCLRATDEEISYIIRKGEKISHPANGDLEDWVKANHDFHNAIAKASHNDLMQQFVPILSQSIDEISHKMPSESRYETNAVTDHQMILDFIRVRNAEGARNAMSIHLLHMIDTMGLDVFK